MKISIEFEYTELERVLQHLEYWRDAEDEKIATDIRRQIEGYIK